MKCIEKLSVDNANLLPHRKGLLLQNVSFSFVCLNRLPVRSQDSYRKKKERRKADTMAFVVGGGGGGDKMVYSPLMFILLNLVCSLPRDCWVWKTMGCRAVSNASCFGSERLMTGWEDPWKKMKTATLKNKNLSPHGLVCHDKQLPAANCKQWVLTRAQASSTSSTLLHSRKPDFLLSSLLMAELSGPNRQTGLWNITSDRSTLSYASFPSCFLALKANTEQQNLFDWCGYQTHPPVHPMQRTFFPTRDHIPGKQTQG